MSNKEEELPQQGLGCPAAGAPEGIVPALTASSSHDGLSPACTAGAGRELATAMSSVLDRPQSRNSQRSAMEVSDDLVWVDSSPESLRSSVSELRSNSSVSGLLGKRNTAKRKKKIDTSDEEIVKEADSGLRSRSTSRSPRAKKNMPGRPAKDPTHVGQFTAAKLAERKREKMKKRDQEIMEQISDSSVPMTPNRRLRQSVIHERELVDEFRQQPVVSLTSITTDAMNTVRKVALKSSNLKGGFIGELWKATEHANAAIHAMYEKLHDSEPSLRVEMDALREEITALKRENAALKEQLEKIKTEKHNPVASSSRAIADVEKSALINREVELPPVYRPSIQGTSKRLLSPPRTRRTERKETEDLSNVLTILLPKILAELGYTPTVKPPIETGKMPPPSLPGNRANKGKGKMKKRTSSESKEKTATVTLPSQSLRTDNMRMETSSRATSTPITKPQEQWTTVVKKGRKTTPRVVTSTPDGKVPTTRKAQSSPSSLAKVAKERTKKKKRRIPTTEAVTLMGPPDQLAEIVQEARNKISLESLNIAPMRTRKAATGALLYEVAEGPEKADALYNALSRTFAGREEIKISRPMKKAELRIHGLQEGTTTNDIAKAVAETGGCSTAHLKIGALRPSAKGVYSVWIQGPLAAMIKVANVNNFSIGWTKTRVTLLEARPLQCYRCHERGHVRATCVNPVDRSASCFKCGKEGHPAKECTGRVICSACEILGRPANHKIGGLSCKPPVKKNNINNKGKKNNVPMETDSASASNKTISINTLQPGNNIAKVVEESTLQETNLDMEVCQEEDNVTQ